MSVLSKKWFHDEEAAFAFLESELWPNGPVCPHCGGVDRISKIKANPASRPVAACTNAATARSSSR